MIEVYWLTLKECLALHDSMIALFGGSGGVRDRGLLESALARPRQMNSYAQSTLPELASALAEGIVKNHPFLDGNKRTGFMMAAGFLERNGMIFEASQPEAVLKTLALASGEMTREEYAQWLEAHSRAE